MPVTLELKSLTGISAGELTRHNAYLGVSFSKTTYFSRSVMEAYVDWACSHCCDLLVIVADHMEAYNAAVFKGIAFAEAEERTMRTGLELQRAYEKTVSSTLRQRVRVRLASDILQDAGCRDILDMVHAVAGAHAAFQRDLRHTVHIALEGKLQSFAPTAAEQEAALATLMNYIIEEIAVILFITGAAKPRYQVSIFPYRPPQILIDLYGGVYGSDFNALTRGAPYAAVELVTLEQDAAINVI